jgi:hypothetical protein
MTEPATSPLWGTRTSATVSPHKAIAAHEPEHSGQHLIAAGAVVRVQQHDFIGFRAVDLTGMAQANHVFGVVAAVVVPHAGLRTMKGKPFLAVRPARRRWECRRTVRSGYRAGPPRRWTGHAADLVVGQRVVTAQRRGMGSESRCELHGFSNELLWFQS